MSPGNVPSDPSQSPLYFGFGSNLWLEQMHTRCPDSPYHGVARLPNYKWIINERGYANVVEVSAEEAGSDAAHAVYGLVYALLSHDEARLDKNEGVPHAYTKEYLACDFWKSTKEKRIDVSAPPSETGKKMLVYIDRKRMVESTPKEEYVYRMNRGIEDAVKMGVPEAYVDEVMRQFIPAEKQENQRRSLEEKARRQAGNFIDENLNGKA